MKTSFAFISLFAILVIFFYGCTKKDIQTVETSETCECPTFPEGQNYNVDLIEINDSLINLHSQYNPHDDNEIMYIALENNLKKLYRYNLVTQNKQFVREFTNILSFNWGTNDWILLELGDMNLWKMKSNGDSLEQLSFDRPYFHPKWNIDCSKIMAYHYIPSQKQQVEILTDEGVLLDSITDVQMNNFCIYGSWKNDNGLIVGNEGNVVKVVDPINKQFLLTKTFPENITEVTWLNNEEIIAIAPFGLYKFNIISQKITKLRCQCPKVSYQKPRAKSDGTGLTMTKLTYDQIGTSVYVNVKYEIVEVNSSGLDEVVIDIP